ncbi:uncharacterized protein LOC114517397 [Dendronephthya gigantea]|uniref:uncharacterized protein LOC114517397 n=1 Tax=Dendronephthya gigantea TaxID=151771 RepID=UPI00106B9F4D|nr:uncharacterized protein LOC114517397 [Dendronephthya gigantea]
MAIGLHIVMLLLVVNSAVSIAKGLSTKPMKIRVNENIQGDGRAASVEARKVKRFYEKPVMQDSSKSFESGKNIINENIHDDGANEGDSWHKNQHVKRDGNKKRKGQRKVKERPLLPKNVRETHG